MPDQKPSTQQERLKQRLDEVNEANKDPLNQAALRWLRHQPRKQQVNQDQQHCLQLMLWGLDEANLGWPHRSHTEAMRASLLDLDQCQNQAAWLRFLLGNPDEPNVTDLEVKNASDKASAAWRLLDGLDRQFQSQPENNGVYPPQDPLRLPGD